MVAARIHHHLLTVVVTSFCLVGVVSHPAIAAPAAGATVGCDLAGSGTSADPYQVATAADLAEVGTDCARSAEYLQTADITLPTPPAGQSNHTPIAPCPGSWPYAPSDYFSGVFDGAGRTITGLIVRDTSVKCRAMFGFVNGTLRDVHLIDVVIEGQDFTAGLAAQLSREHSGTGVISGSSVTGTISGRDYVAGLVASSTGSITDSSTAATVNGQDQVGGLVGIFQGATTNSITNSSTSGSVDGRSVVGGLVGRSYLRIVESRATGNVTGTGSQVGGLVGQAYGNISRSFATGHVTGSDKSGGLVGELFFPTISDSYAKGNVTATPTGASVGGLVGVADYEAKIVDSYATGAVSAHSTAGGLIGRLDRAANRSTVDRSFASGAVTVTTGTPGALVGVDNGTIDAVSAGVTATALRDIDTFTGWAIVSEWEASAPSATPPKVWGICASTNDGHPYLLWQFTAATKPTSCDGTTTTSSSVPTSSTPSSSTPSSSTPASSAPSSSTPVSSTPAATTPATGAPDTSGTTTTAATTTTSLATDPPPATPVATTTAPARRPGEAGATVDGVESPVQMSTEGPVVLAVDGATVAIDGAGVAVVDSVVTLAVGGEVEMTGTGLPPGTTGEVVIMSEPRRLGTFAVAGDGTMSLRTTMPDDLAVGDHTIMMSVGTLQLTLGVTVTDSMEDASTAVLPTTGWAGDHLMVALVITSLGTLIALARRPRNGTRPHQ